MQLTINDRFYEGESIEGFGQLLNEINGLINAEVWLAAPNGATICLLKSAKNAVLIYLRDEDDNGVHSVGDESKQGKFQLQLPNDDPTDPINDYPLSWCIELENAYKVLSYFFVNNGEKSPFIDWSEDNN